MRLFLATFFSPYSLSNTALLWATIIGAIGSLVFVMTPSSAGQWASWLVVVAVSQALFAIVIVGMRMLQRACTPLYVACALGLAGAVRGIAIAFGVQVHLAQPLDVSELVSRTANSMVISVLGVALIGGTLAWLAQYRGEYQVLVDRAVALERMRAGEDHVDLEVLETWTTVKLALNDALERARQELTTPATAEGLESASALIAATVNVELRPVSQAMWTEPAPTKQRLRIRSFFADTLRTWRPPILVILAFYVVVIGTGAIVRIGWADGSAFVARYVIAVGVILWISKVFAARFRAHASIIAGVTLIALPLALLLADLWIVKGILGAPLDAIGDVTIALQTPVTVLFIATAVSTFRDRPRILGALQQRIDSDVVSIVTRQSDVRQLGLYIHHSVQSELSAIAMQLHEAALTQDAQTRDAVSTSVLERLQRFQSIDAATPPWLRREGGKERINEVIAAWAGIMTIHVELPNEEECRLDQWHVAAQVIEEALANAARHGDASEVSIQGFVGSELMLVISDNGMGREQLEAIRPGIGSQWLEWVAPGEWSLVRTTTGATLTVAIS